MTPLERVSEALKEKGDLYINGAYDPDGLAHIVIAALPELAAAEALYEAVSTQEEYGDNLSKQTLRALRDYEKARRVT